MYLLAKSACMHPGERGDAVKIARTISQMVCNILSQLFM